MEEKYLEIEGEHVAYSIVKNSGPFLVLVHGYPEDQHIFQNQIAFLQENYSLIIPDLPGAGNSPFNENIATVEDYAKVLHTIISHENIEKVTMLGHSMGGYITLAFAELFPDFLSKFGMIHSTAVADSDEKIEGRFVAIENIEKLGVTNYCKNAIKSNFAPDFANKNETIIAQLISYAEKSTVESLQNFQSIMIQRKDRTKILNTGKPVFFAIGTEDKAAPLAQVIPQVSLPNISSVHIYPNVGHLSMFEAPDQLNQSIQTFLEL
ncbi:alpha/beta fold hydrolase [Rhizosphaericola mali]|uniref:Alpha/beta hydrolase n=1 Tax=Rhizosphaericola mali TaxID=2545455 RepID=A0A5P2G335_9BACT|nr:alpha/beta hydrolase [Rhizosphaericola mali]QES88220.1 alpha/beta hydrolase [Rhizosphaericola mali]